MQHSKTPFPFQIKYSVWPGDMMDGWGCGTQLEAGVWLGVQGGLGLPFLQSLVAGSDGISAWMEGKKNPKISFHRENFHRTPPQVLVFFVSRFESAFLWKWVSLPSFCTWERWRTYTGWVYGLVAGSGGDLRYQPHLWPLLKNGAFPPPDGKAAFAPFCHLFVFLSASISA